MAVLSTAYSSSACLRFRAFNLNNLSAIIATTGGTGMVRQLGAIALRAIDQRRGILLEMTPSLTLARFSIFSLR